MAIIDSIIGFLNTIFWGYILIYGLLAVGIFFTLRLKFIQFLHFKELFTSVFDKGEADQSGITPLQALTVSLASRVGTGNLTGVAVALYLGGAGAIFWMWMVALVGMATAYSESTLAQLYAAVGRTARVYPWMNEPGDDICYSIGHGSYFFIT